MPVLGKYTEPVEWKRLRILLTVDLSIMPKFLAIVTLVDNPPSHILIGRAKQAPH